MRKSCGQRVEIALLGCGTEHNLCTLGPPALKPHSAELTEFPQFIRTICTVLSQPNKALFNLLLSTFSPQSTMPINTITIHIN